MEGGEAKNEASDCRAGGAIWLNPFATVLFSMCSAIMTQTKCTLTLTYSLIIYDFLIKFFKY